MKTLTLHNMFVLKCDYVMKCIMATVFFSYDDKDKTLSQLYSSNTLDEWKLTLKDLYGCKTIHNNYKGIWDMSLDLIQIEWCGFASFEDMKNAFIRCKLYSDINRFPNLSLETYITYCGVSNVVWCRKKGTYHTLYDLLDSLDIDQLIDLGI